MLFKYCLYKIPEIKFDLKISREEKIKQDFKEILKTLPLIDKKYMISDFMTIYSVD